MKDKEIMIETGANMCMSSMTSHAPIDVTGFQKQGLNSFVFLHNIRFQRVIIYELFIISQIFVWERILRVCSHFDYCKQSFQVFLSQCKLYLKNGLKI